MTNFDLNVPFQLEKNTIMKKILLLLMCIPKVVLLVIMRPLGKNGRILEKKEIWKKDRLVA